MGNEPLESCQPFLVAIVNPIEAAHFLSSLFTTTHLMTILVLIKRLSRWNYLESIGG